MIPPHDGHPPEHVNCRCLPVAQIASAPVDRRRTLEQLRVGDVCIPADGCRRHGEPLMTTRTVDNKPMLIVADAPCAYCAKEKLGMSECEIAVLNEPVGAPTYGHPRTMRMRASHVVYQLGGYYGDALVWLVVRRAE